MSKEDTRVEEEEVVVDSMPQKTSFLHKSPNPYVPLVPIPGRLKRDKLSKLFKDILDILSKVNVNISLLDMMEKMHV